MDKKHILGITKDTRRQQRSHKWDAVGMPLNYNVSMMKYLKIIIYNHFTFRYKSIIISTNIGSTTATQLKKQQGRNK